MTPRCHVGGVVGLLVFLTLPPIPVGALEAELDLTVERTMVQAVVGPPGTSAQEVGIDHGRTEALVNHRQTVGAGWSAEGTLMAALDTLPSGDPRNLSPRKLDPSFKVLEGWIGWEVLPGELSLGAGKRLLAPSSGFHHKPLDWVTRPDDREGRTGAMAAWFGEAWSTSVFAAPALPFDGTDQGFVFGRVGVNLGSVDLKVQALKSSGPPRGGLGLDAGWGDHLTFRAEGAADADPDRLGADLLAGVTVTAEDRSTVMVEMAWDDRETSPLTGFLRGARDIDDRLSGEAWVKVAAKPGTSPNDLGGWVGTVLKWTAPQWSVEGTWIAAWGPPGTSAGDSPLRWKLRVETKTFW